MTLNASYASYLLRLRQLNYSSRATWVASVQSIATGDERSFPSVEALAAFLLAEFGERRQTGAESRDGTAGSPEDKWMTQV